jgi:hypothetical protein
MREPVDITFVLRGDIEKEIEKVKLTVQKMGTEGTVSYRNLLNASNEAFNALSKDAQSQAIALQKVITQIRLNEEAQASLKKKYEDGEISASKFAESSARLSVQQAELKATASGLSVQLQREIQISKEVEGSYNQKIIRLKQLKETYAQLSEEERNNADIGGKMIESIRQLDGETKKFEESLKAVEKTIQAEATSIDGMQEKLSKLQKQYNALSEEQRNNKSAGGALSEQIKTLTADIDKAKVKHKEHADVIKVSSTSIDGMRSRLSDLEKQYNALSKADRSSEIGKSLSNQMRVLSHDIDTAENANRSFIEQLKAAPRTIGSTVSGIEAMTKAALRFIATPLGAIIAAIVVAIKALTTWFRRTEEGEMSLAKISAYFGQVLNSLLNVVSKVGEWLYKAFTKPKDALNDLVEFLKGQFVNRLNAFSKWGQGFMKLFSKDTFMEGMTDMADATFQLFSGIDSPLNKLKQTVDEINKKSDRQAQIATELKKIERERADLSVQVASAESKIADLRAKAKNNQKDEQERLKAIKEAQKLIDDSASKEIGMQKRVLELTKESLLLKYGVTDVNQLNTESYKTIRDLEKDIANRETARLNKQRELLDQQNAINNAIKNEKTGQELLEEELKKKKEAYELYYRYITATSKATAQSMFSDLVKEGNSYLEYINGKITELQNKPNRTQQENIQLTVYTSEKQELTGSGSNVDILKREIDEKKRLYNEDIIAFRNYLREKKKVLSEDMSEEGYKQKVIVEVELQTTDESYKNKIDDLLKRYGSYTTQMVSLTKDYQKNKAVLEEQGTQEAKAAIDNLTAEYNNAVLQLKNGSDSFLKAIFGDIDRLGYQALQNLKNQAKDAIDSAKETTQGGQTFMIVNIEEINKQGQVVKKQVKLTVEEFARLKKQYNELYDLTEDKNPFQAVSDSFNGVLEALKSGDKEKMSTAIEAFNTSMTKSINTVQSWGDSLGQIFGSDVSDAVNFLTGLTQGVTDLGTGVAQLASGDIVGGITNTLKGAAEIYSTLTAGAKKYREDQKKWMNELIKLQIDYNSVLNEQIRVQQQSNVFITDYVRNIQNAFSALDDAQANMDDLLGGKSLDRFLSELEFKIGVAKKKFLGITTGSKNVYGDLGENFSKLVKDGSFSDLIDDAGTLNVELAKTLLNLEGITDETKNSLEELISYQEQIDAAVEAINSAIESIAGSIGSDLYSALRESWDAGTDSFEAFKESVSAGVKDIVSQLLFNEIFSDQFDKLQENLKESFSLGGDQSVLDDFTTFLNSSPALLAQWEQSMNEFEEAAKAAGFEIDKLNEDLTGTTSESIADAISSGFENGYRSASDFADTFKDLMKQAVLEAMKLQVLEQPLQAWYNSFSASMQNGTLAQDLTSLNEQFNSIIEQAAEYLSAVESATGLDFGVNQTADKNSITTVSEETATKLEGHFVAVRINTGKLVESAESILALTAKNQLHLAAIERNTGELSRLETIESSIRRIENNGIKLKS